jgi:hypothetical protein
MEAAKVRAKEKRQENIKFEVAEILSQAVVPN